MSESESLDLTEQFVLRLADLLAEACHTAREADQFGTRGFQKRANELRGAVILFADHLPTSVSLAVAREVRKSCESTEGDDTRSVALRSLLRLVDPSGSSDV